MSVAVALALGSSLLVVTGPAATSREIANHALARAVGVEVGGAQANPKSTQVSGSVAVSVLEATGAFARRATSASTNAAPRVQSSLGTQGCQNVFRGHGTRNIRVNQDCSLRRQAEEVVAIDPNHPGHLIAGQNDSRVGFNKCGYDWSFDGGRTWGDQIPPFYQFLMADGHTADACSDPTATFDSRGNAYIGGVLFDIASPASAFVVAKSNASIGGAFYHTPQSGPFQEYSDAPLGVVASDNDPNVFNDKEFVVADASASSPKRDNVYATWMRFHTFAGPVGGDSPIFFSQSADGGATWSAGIEISGAGAMCTDFSNKTNANACDQDQGSHPIVGSGGTIYVAFGNGNTPTLGLNQHLMVRCPATADCTNPASWVAPSKISDDFGMQPVGPDASTACPAGRQCLPPNGYRLDDFTQGSISVDNAGKLYAVWADFRNGRGSSCDWNNAAAGQAAVATPPCDNDVFYAFSTNHGATWSRAINVTPASRIGKSAQWMPWSAVAPNGQKLFIGYYDRSYGRCETTGCNDITMATITRPSSASAHVRYTRVTTASMPNLVVANNPVQAGFLGDYMWVSTDRHGNPSVVWADTRGLHGTVEEDIYYATPGR
jgi:hypothetical protein